MRQRDDVVAAELDDGLALLEPASNHYYHLNAVGAFVWRQIDQEIGVDGIVSRVCCEFDVSQEQALEDVKRLVTQLEAAGLIEA